MGHYPDHQKGAEQIRRVAGDHHEPVQHKQKDQDHGNRAEQSQLLADNGEDHVVLGLGKEAELLDTLSQPFSKEAA